MWVARCRSQGAAPFCGCGTCAPVPLAVPDTGLGALRWRQRWRGAPGVWRTCCPQIRRGLRSWWMRPSPPARPGRCGTARRVRAVDGASPASAAPRGARHTSAPPEAHCRHCLQGRWGGRGGVQGAWGSRRGCGGYALQAHRSAQAPTGWDSATTVPGPTALARPGVPSGARHGAEGAQGHKTPCGTLHGPAESRQCSGTRSRLAGTLACAPLPARGVRRLAATQSIPANCTVLPDAVLAAEAKHRRRGPRSCRLLPSGPGTPRATLRRQASEGRLLTWK